MPAVDPKAVLEDDKITRIHKNSVSLEIVERVDRHIFYTVGSSIALEHTGENRMWLRGHFMLDDMNVRAAQTAQVLTPDSRQPASPIGVTGPIGSVGRSGAPPLRAQQTADMATFRKQLADYERLVRESCAVPRRWR